MKPALLGLALALSGTLALAQEPTAAPAASSEPPAHRLTVYARSGLSVYLSDARTAGGVGGGFGVRDTLEDRFILQADASYLLALGNAVEVRVGAGVQRRGTYTPAALLVLSGLMGNQLRFLTPAHPSPVEGPALSLGLQLAPLRFTHEGLQLSVLELGVGVGSDLPGTGVAWHVGLLEVGTSF
jgi:hypothetical protein